MVTSLHHVGCLVESIDEAIEDYRILHPAGEVSEIYDIEDQKVKVCFFTIGTVHVEFVEPRAGNEPLLNMLRKKPGFYHIGLYVSDIQTEIERLEASGYRKINVFKSEAFNGRLCSFLYNNEMHLIELIEQA